MTRYDGMMIATSFQIRTVILAAVLPAVLGGAALVLGSLAPLTASEARAQGMDAEMFYPHLWRTQPRGTVVRRRPPQVIRRAAPPRDYAAPVTGGAAPVVAPPVPKVEASRFVAVLGDSLGVMAAQGLQKVLADRPDIGVLQKSRESSGLVRDDFYDWPKAVAELLASGQTFEAAVLMVGSNDRQALRDESGVHEPFSPRWKELYAARAGSIARAFRDAKVPLIWVGMPVMRAERYAADMQALNALFRDAAESNGAIFIDVWDRFAGEEGQYDQFGPDLSGQNVRLRASDGIHFTRAGAEKLAHFIESEIRRLLEPRGPPQAPAVAAPADGQPTPIENPETMDVTARILAALEDEKRRDPSRPEFLGIILPPEIAPQALPPPRPAAGPVVSLTAPALSPGGLLAGPSAGPGGGQTAARQVFYEGRPAETRPGRADDFSWPRR